MKTSTTTALAPILRTTPANCIARARSIGQGLTVTCRRCGGSGNYGHGMTCYDCGGARVVLAADALTIAAALVASGELDAYLARTEAKRVAAEAEKRAEAAYRVAVAERLAAIERNCAALVARYDAALASVRALCAEARTLGLADAAARAEGIAAEASRLTAPDIHREPRLTRAAWAMETLAAEFGAFVADARPVVAAPLAWDTCEETYRAALARRAEMDAADAAAATFARLVREAQASEMVVAL